MNRLSTQQPGGALLFGGTLSEPATVKLGGQPAAVSSTNAFSGTVPAASGTSQVAVQATDYSGNVRTNTYEVTQAGAAKTFTYDANGNLIGDGTKTYEWDAENRLQAVKQAGNTLASFTYDGQGRRAAKTAGGVTTTYVYSGAEFLEERPSAGATNRYVYGPGTDRPLAQSTASVASYFVGDHLGSLVRATDASGAPTLAREYGPWGSPIQGSTTGGYAFTAESGTLRLGSTTTERDTTIQSWEGFSGKIRWASEMVPIAIRMCITMSRIAATRSDSARATTAQEESGWGPLSSSKQTLESGRSMSAALLGSAF